MTPQSDSAATPRLALGRALIVSTLAGLLFFLLTFLIPARLEKRVYIRVPDALIEGDVSRTGFSGASLAKKLDRLFHSKTWDGPPVVDLWIPKSSRDVRTFSSGQFTSFFVTFDVSKYPWDEPTGKRVTGALNQLFPVKTTPSGSSLNTDFELMMDTAPAPRRRVDPFASALLAFFTLMACYIFPVARKTSPNVS